VWEVDLLDAYGIDPDVDRVTVAYGRSGSPLVHGDLVIIPVGAPNLVAFDKKTGEPVWTGSNHQVSYSSPVVAELAGIEQVIIVNEDTVTGHELATGRLLWEHPWPGRSEADATASQAVPLPPSSVFVSKGYGVGAALLDLEPSAAGTLAVRQRWHTRRSMRTKFTNVMMVDGHVYGLSDGMLECIDLERGRRAWKDGRYGHGQILGVGDLMLVLSEEGELLLIEASPEEPNSVLGRVDAIDGLTWNNLALAGDLLLVRNGHEATAFRVAVEKRELP
jgi:outer membrane protein assembly factor BamB